ncbi:hypothetical protein [Aquisediminimonas sediminicola]|uniref:hypothetical protein n=1 Tax=Alteraquisediminimonas sediminicola TaxID=2676787 RepID=UPI001C8D2BC9|nr:hypothetical protein [Aquisediminimonas sediminicola]
MLAQELLPAALSIAMIAIAVLIWGGINVMRRQNKQRGILMLAAALVLLLNVLIIGLPT